MDQATYHLPKGFVWPTVGHPGSVPLWTLVPTPKQPRQHFDDDELSALAETMKPHKRGQQREIMTVRELTREERGHYHPARYMIKSGERRWRAAALAGLGMLEIRVKEYTSVADEKLDAYMLNENRVGLSDIENAEAVSDIMLEHKLETQAELAQLIGKDQVWVSQHLALLKLSPKVRALMSPKIKKQERLKREVGVFFSRLSLETQDELVDRMPKGRTPATQQIHWLREQLKGTSEEPAPKRHKPSTLRQVIGYYANQVERRAGELMAFEEFNLLFENATKDQIYKLFDRIRVARSKLEKLIQKMEETVRTRGQKEREAWSAPVEHPAPIERPTPAPRRAHKPDSYLSGNSKVAHAPGISSRKEKTVTYYSESANRFVTDNLTLGPGGTYEQAWQEKRLKFQMEKNPKPEHYPTLEEALQG